MAKWLLLLVAVWAVSPAEAARRVPQGQNGATLVIPIKGTIDEPLLYVVRQGFGQVRDDQNIRAVLLAMDTPGGRLDVTNEIITYMRESRVPVYVYVEKWAFSAGALISLGTDGIYMAPGSTIGAATPIMMGPSGEQPVSLGEDINEKMKSGVRAMARTLAQEKDYWPELAEAMVDKDMPELKVGERVIKAEGKLLTLTAQEAAEVIPPRTAPLLADGLFNSEAELLTHLKLADTQVIRLEVTGSIRLARLIVSFAPLLLMIGIMALFMEIKTPGAGVPAVVAIICLGLYFFGHHVAGMSGAVEAVLVLVGIVLLLLELFVIPGFGVVGLAGILCLLTGLIMAMIPHVPKVPELPGLPVVTLGDFLSVAIAKISITIIGSAAGIYIASKFLPHTSFYGRLVLQSSNSAAAGYVGTRVEEHKALVGVEGEALTDLRPAGTAWLGGKRLDVVANGNFIGRGTRVRVCEVNGPRVAVEPVPASPPPPAAPPA